MNGMDGGFILLAPFQGCCWEGIYTAFGIAAKTMVIALQ